MSSLHEFSRNFRLLPPYGGAFSPFLRVFNLLKTRGILAIFHLIFGRLKTRKNGENTIFQVSTPVTVTKSDRMRNGIFFLGRVAW